MEHFSCHDCRNVIANKKKLYLSVLNCRAVFKQIVVKSNFFLYEIVKNKNRHCLELKKK